ncbi:hypothetical protein FVEN_g9488 [Fusarium venenatum]|nr:hypothetical protein FVEN_g9488 [Fusarium venenatum]
MISIPPGPIKHKNITLVNDLRQDAEWFEQLESVMAQPRDLLLVWDWGAHSIESLGNQETTYEKLISEQFGPDSLLEELHNVTIVSNMGLVLQDLERHVALEDCIRSAVASFQETLRIADRYAIISNVVGKDLGIKTGVETVTDTLVQFQGGWQPLRWASEDGHDLVIRLMLMKADPNIVDAEGRNPLSWASEKGYETLVRLLLGTGAVDPDARDMGGWTPLLWAASKGHETIVKLLLDTQKVDPDAKERKEDTKGTRRTPLLLASEGGYEAVVRRLLDTYKVDLNAHDESGGTPLMWAVKNGHTHVVKLLLQTGKLDPNASEAGEVENEGGRTPLMWAASNCNEEIVKLLLQTKNVSSDVRDKSSRTAISLAAESGDVAIVKMLLGIGEAQPDVPDKEGRTPLRFAAEGGFEEVVQLLLDTNEVNLNSKDKRGRTPLFSAAKNGHEHVVSILAQRNELTFQELQRQVPIPSNHENYLNIQDEDYFDSRCHQLFSNVQQWVTRFSRAGDMRTSRLKDDINEEAVNNLEAVLASQLDDDDDYPATGLPAQLTVGINDEKTVDRLDSVMLDGTDVDVYLSDRLRRRDVFTSMIMNMIWEFIFTRYLFGVDREMRQKLKNLEKLLTEAGPPQAVRKWRAITLTLLSRRDSIKRQRDLDAAAVTHALLQTVYKVLLPPDNIQDHLESQLHKVVLDAAELSIEMRTQKAEYMMLPPLRPEYDADGDLTATICFNADMMNECGFKTERSNEELETHGSIVRMVLFPLVVKKAGDDGVGDEEIVIYPAQVLVTPQNTDEEKVMVSRNNIGKEKALEAPELPTEDELLEASEISAKDKVLEIGAIAAVVLEAPKLPTEDQVLEPPEIPEEEVYQPGREELDTSWSGKRRLGWVRKILTKVKM